MFSNVLLPTNDFSKYNSKRLPNFVLQFTPYLDNIFIKNNFGRHTLSRNDTLKCLNCIINSMLVI